MSGRLVPFAVTVLLFAMLPFLGGSSASSSGQVVLAAGAPGAPDQSGSAMPAASSGAATNAAATTVGAAMGAAMGGGLFMFPEFAFSPVAGQSITAAALTTPRLGGPHFIFPVNGAEVSPFGPRIHPVLGRPMFHTGIDLAAVCGTPIRAAAAGRVIYARVSPSWGLRTIIQHTPGLKTAYGHQSAFLVKEGDVVRQGQVIGFVGTTGWSTGCHLHFDVIVNDRYVDPAPYLGLPGSRADSIPFGASPHFVIGQGSVMRTVEDGDVPVPVYSTGGSSTTTTGGTSTSPSSPRPTTSSSTGTSTSTTTSPSTSTSTSTSPSTSTSTGTTTTTPSDTTTTSQSSTTTPQASTTTTSDPPPTSDPSTTSDPSPSTSDTSTTPDPAPAQTLDSTTTGMLETSTEIGTTSDPASTPAAEPTSTTADITTTSQP